jgi:hypothetical protein
MHLVYRESRGAVPGRSRGVAMARGRDVRAEPGGRVFLLGGILNLWMRPPAFGRVIGGVRRAVHAGQRVRPSR